MGRGWEGGGEGGSEGGGGREGGGREGGGREGGRDDRKRRERITIIQVKSHRSTHNTMVPTALRHSFNVGVRESDKGECSRLGGDCLVKENTVHGAGEVQL